MLACIPLPKYSRQITCSPPAGVVDVIVCFLNAMVNLPVASLGSKATIPPFSAPSLAELLTQAATLAPAFHWFLSANAGCFSAMQC